MEPAEMIYSNPEFFILFGLTLAAYSLARSYRLRFLVLLAASLTFYAWAGLFDGLIFVLVILVSWSAVAFSEKYPAAKSRLIPLGICVIAAHLFVWKYASWLIGEIHAVSPGFWGGRELFLPLPVGISFFTLQSIAYMVDYSRGQTEFVTLPVYALFKSFFAQLLAGPIVRGSQLNPQLKKLPRPAAADVTLGVCLFVLGFVKKMAVADRVAYFVDAAFSSPQNFGRFALLKALLGYTVQIWADFSGYTDMGRGAALILGIRLPENFLSPYLSQSPSEFWRRWHITLSTWITDYIFTPLAMRSRALGAQGLFFFAAVTTMLIAGIWHGAGWNFALFGLYHGFLLVLEKRGLLPRDPKSPWSPGGLARIALMFCLIQGGWLVFRIESMHQLFAFLKGLAFGSPAAQAATGRSVFVLAAFCLGIQAAFYYDPGKKTWVFMTPLKEKTMKRLDEMTLERPALASVAGLCAGVALAALLMGALLLRPDHTRGFIYFQF
jgi:D-alanyl-lipoteichoic acid acyltransferase DltB (MBOAT superfamily)